MTARPGDDASERDWPNRLFWGRSDIERNVGAAERWISGAAGVALLAYPLGRQRMRLLLVPIGLGLVRRAVTGRCEVKRAIGNLKEHRAARGLLPRPAFTDGRRIEQAVVIHRAPSELFQFWRQFENLPRFMDNLESVTMRDERRMHWVAKGPLGTRLEWDAEVHDEIEDEMIAWRSLPDAEIEQSGSVHFSAEVSGVPRFAWSSATRLRQDVSAQPWASSSATTPSVRWPTISAASTR